MKLSFVIRVSCMLIVWLPSAGWAASYNYMAETSAPAKRQGMVVAGGIQWICGGQQCSASGPWPTPNVQSCRSLALQVGQLKSFGHAKKKLNGAEISQCNAGISDAAPGIKTGLIPTPSPMPGPKVPTPPAKPPEPKPPMPSAKGPAPWTGSKSFTSLSLTVTGTGALSARGVFTPQSFTSPGLTLTGTGALR